jgi:hypothetical protein
MALCHIPKYLNLQSFIKLMVFWGKRLIAGWRDIDISVSPIAVIFRIDLKVYERNCHHSVILLISLNPSQYLLWQIYTLISRPQTPCKFNFFFKSLRAFHDLSCGFLCSVPTREMETSSFNFIHTFSYKLLSTTVIDWRQLTLTEFGI